MDIERETTAGGITEQCFTLRAGGVGVPGQRWLPPGPAAPSATILIGHGGTGHKQSPNVVALAHRLVLGAGYAAVALDAPAHGDRMTPEQRAAQAARVEAARVEAARVEAARVEAARPEQAGAPPARRGISPTVWQAMLAAAPQAVAEWQALLDALDTPGPFGYWGVSMGTVYGLPLLAREPRISAAVLGLMGLLDGGQVQREQAAAITVPLLFLLQADDQLVPREAGLALWDAFGSAQKSVHVNPGAHGGIPEFERAAAVTFYQRHLSR